MAVPEALLPTCDTITNGQFRTINETGNTVLCFNSKWRPIVEDDGSSYANIKTGTYNAYTEWTENRAGVLMERNVEISGSRIVVNTPGLYLVTTTAEHIVSSDSVELFLRVGNSVSTSPFLQFTMQTNRETAFVSGIVEILEGASKSERTFQVLCASLCPQMVEFNVIWLRPSPSTSISPDTVVAAKITDNPAGSGTYRLMNMPAEPTISTTTHLFSLGTHHAIGQGGDNNIALLTTGYAFIGLTTRGPAGRLLSRLVMNSWGSEFSDSSHTFDHSLSRGIFGHYTAQALQFYRHGSYTAFDDVEMDLINLDGWVDQSKCGSFSFSRPAESSLGDKTLPSTPTYDNWLAKKANINENYEFVVPINGYYLINAGGDYPYEINVKLTQGTDESFIRIANPVDVSTESRDAGAMIVMYLEETNLVTLFSTISSGQFSAMFLSE